MRSFILSVFALSFFNVFGADEKDICFFKQGVVFQELSADKIDSAAVSDNEISLYDASGKMLYSTALKNIDSICFLDPVPQADVLDVMFNPDGTAQDVSPMHNKVEAAGKPQVIYSGQYGRYFVRFSDNVWGGTANRYYKIDYANNSQFQKALADGHTMETVIRCSYPGTIEDVEAKYFSGHQSGGMGLMITKVSGTRKNELAYLPYIGGAYRWGTSGIVPVSGVDYHIVGVWNKETQTVHIYINGKLMNTVSAPGELKFPASAYCYFAIGGDPASSVNQSFNGDVILARIYDAPLSSGQVSALWKRLQDTQGVKDVQVITNLNVFSGLKVVPGKPYQLYGNGFEANDKIVFTDDADPANTFTVSVTLIGKEGVSFNLPYNLKSATYRMRLVREGKTQDLGLNQLDVVDQLPRGSKVIAHRGFFTGTNTSQNSRASLKAALALNDCFGSETDVRLTSDGHLIINHDASYGGVNIENSTYDQVKNLTLSNGEKIPQLQDFLDILAADTSNVKLIIEVKTLSTIARTCACVDSVVAAVKAMNLQDRVEYLAFSYDACKEFLAKDPSAKVAYLNGDKSPSELQVYGIRGIAYTQAKTTDIYLSLAHQLGMTSNVWTIDTISDMIYTNNRDVDYLTSNYPDKALQVYKHYKNNR